MGFFYKVIPFFLLMIGVELALDWYLRSRRLQFEDSLRNLMCGALEEVVGVFARLSTAWIYVSVFERFRLWNIPENFLGWTLSMVAVDFCYYWFHRASHRVGFLWAMHAVHHQSEFYNLTVSLRQSALGGFFNWAFYLPLAITGISPKMMFLSYSLNLIYQFWIHTELIQKIPGLESTMNTPSHHRVHHGRNSKYIDKNYAGILIIWDRIFGTFEPEIEKVDYGVVKPLTRENPVWANIEGWLDLWRKSKRGVSLKEKIYAWVSPPEWEPKSSKEETSPEIENKTQGHSPKPSTPLKKAASLLLFVAGLVYLIAFFEFVLEKDLHQRILHAVLLITWFGFLGQFIESKRIPTF